MGYFNILASNLYMKYNIPLTRIKVYVNKLLTLL